MTETSLAALEAPTVSDVAGEVLARLKQLMAKSPNRSMAADFDQVAAEFANDHTRVATEPPAQVPTEPGHYVDKQDDWAYLAADGSWMDSFTYGVEPSVIASRAPLTRVRPVAEVAAEVLADIKERYENELQSSLMEDYAIVAAKYGVTL